MAPEFLSRSRDWPLRLPESLIFPDLPDVLGPELLEILARCRDFAEALANGDERAFLQFVDAVEELRLAAKSTAFVSPQGETERGSSRRGAVWPYAPSFARLG